MRVRRRFQRSARMPASGARKNVSIWLVHPTTPNIAFDPVSRYASHPMAMLCIHVPPTEMPWPIKYNRKLRWRRERKIDFMKRVRVRESREGRPFGADHSVRLQGVRPYGRSAWRALGSIKPDERPRAMGIPQPGRAPFEPTAPFEPAAEAAGHVGVAVLASHRGGLERREGGLEKRSARSAPQSAGAPAGAWWAAVTRVGSGSCSAARYASRTRSSTCKNASTTAGSNCLPFSETRMSWTVSAL